MIKRIVSFILSAALLTGLCACGRDTEKISQPQAAPALSITAADFADGEHKRSEEYMASFKTKGVELDGIKIYFANTVFDETASPAMAEEIASFYYTLKALKPNMASNVTMYIVNLTLDDGPMLIDNTLYFNSGDMGKGDYGTYLAGAAYGVWEHWKRVGLALIAQGDAAAAGFSPGELQEYIYKNGSDSILSLHHCFFNDEFADEATIAMAEGCARSLAEFIIDEHGFKALCDDMGGEMRGLWLESLGLDYDPGWLDEPEAMYLNTMPSFEGNDHPLVLWGDMMQLYLKRVDWLSDANRVYDFLLSFSRQILSLYGYIYHEAPAHYEYLMRTGDIGIVHFRDSDYPTGSLAGTARGECIVTSSGDALHELSHLVVPCTEPQKEELRWLSEGLATYLSAPFVPLEEDRIASSFVDAAEGNFGLELVDEDISFIEESDRIFELLNGCCMAEAGSLNEPVYRVYEALGAAAYLNPDYNSAPGATRSMAELYPLKGSYPGNELSYFESMIFVDYLVGKYGLDTLIAAVMDSEAYYELFPTSAAFRLEHEEFFAQWIEPLR